VRGRIKAVLPSIAAGLVTGLVAVVSCVSFAALIFAGELQVNTADGMALVLISAVPVLSITALFSSYPGTIAIPQDRIAPILALVASGIVAGLPEQAHAAERFHTVAMAIVIASLGTGVFLSVLGWLRWAVCA
jgi:SulP family sulfate permease